MTNELATGCDRYLTLQSGANTAKCCNQGLPCVGLFKRRCAESDILSSSRISSSDQCLQPSPEDNGLGFAKVGLGAAILFAGQACAPCLMMRAICSAATPYRGECATFDHSGKPRYRGACHSAFATAGFPSGWHPPQGLLQDAWRQPLAGTRIGCCRRAPLCSAYVEVHRAFVPQWPPAPTGSPLP